MKNEERRAATRELRRRLEDIRNAVAAQDAALADARARADERARLLIPPRARERFELLCTVPVMAAPAGAPAPTEWSGVRC